jgi:hypothetical protein
VYDSRILAWFANWEPATGALLSGLITRAYAADRVSVPLLDPYCRAGEHANCPGRLCRCLHCQHRRPR